MIRFSLGDVMSRSTASLVLGRVTGLVLVAALAAAPAFAADPPNVGGAQIAVKPVK